ncbi:hypothetical protein [Serratia fonticola]|uniref:Uncharacterized protein n=1 Tax=Serratia fonticola TaxID=47917 RepID=A0AAW3WLT0_SERFO|nr:hypothetical protein [Serratia fonticola]MBC3211395.1 hypothetical protein [Serratia fonticola]NYA12377.1 hypothetical protein [Serratia fonticola]NYA31956.1 hypothetical protein [Serratia fonticola]
MIYLQQGEEFIEVDDWQVISSRASYKPDLNIKDRNLEKIIGYYELPEKLKCGLSSCHTPHLRGYVVQTDDGCETNIGNACGKKYFDVVFEQMSKDFINALEFAKLKIQLSEAKKDIFPLWQKVNALAVGHKNVEWAIRWHEKINNADLVGYAAYRLLREMFAANSGNVMSTREPTREEIELAQVSGRAMLQSVDVVVGFVSDIGFMSPDNDLKKLYHNDLRGTVQALQDCDINKLSRTQMQPIAKGLNALDTNIAKTQDWVNIARQFFVKENLAQLLNGMTTNRNVGQADIQRYKDFVETL